MDPPRDLQFMQLITRHPHRMAARLRRVCGTQPVPLPHSTGHRPGTLAVFMESFFLQPQSTGRLAYHTLLHPLTHSTGQCVYQKGPQPPLWNTPAPSRTSTLGLLHIKTLRIIITGVPWSSRTVPHGIRVIRVLFSEEGPVSDVELWNSDGSLHFLLLAVIHRRGVGERQLRVIDNGGCECLRNKRQDCLNPYICLWCFAHWQCLRKGPSCVVGRLIGAVADWYHMPQSHKDLGWVALKVFLSHGHSTTGRQAVAAGQQATGTLPNKQMHNFLCQSCHIPTLQGRV